MASFVYNTAKHTMIRGGGTPAVDWKNDAGIKFMLLSGSHTPDADHDFVSNLSNELSGTGYVAGFGGSGRHAIGSRDVLKDDTGDLVKLTGANPAVWTASGMTARYLVAIKEITSDADSPVIFLIDLNPTAGIVLDGNDWQPTMPANGWARF